MIQVMFSFLFMWQRLSQLLIRRDMSFFFFLF